MNRQLRQADAEALAGRFRTLLSTIRSAEAELGTVLAEIATRGVLDLYGYRSLASWVSDTAGISRTAAYRLVRRAQALNPAHRVDGTFEPALAPATGEAAREGTLSTPAIDAIVSTLSQIPAPERDRAEAQLLDVATHAEPARVAAVGQQIVKDLVPSPSPESTAPQRELTLHRRRNGSWELKGKFDDETGTRTSTLLDALANPHCSDDQRTRAERLGDAFSTAVDMAMSSSTMPAQAGLAAVSLNDLKPDPNEAKSDSPPSITTTEARIRACDAAITNESPNADRLRILVTTGLREALHARDRGCAFPNCDRPAENCSAHHIEHWVDGGPTTLENTVLTCGHHHRLLHTTDWDVRIAPDGLPEFLPPQYLDPQRRPRRNNRHRPVPFAA